MTDELVQYWNAELSYRQLSVSLLAKIPRVGDTKTSIPEKELEKNIVLVN